MQESKYDSHVTSPSFPIESKHYMALPGTVHGKRFYIASLYYIVHGLQKLQHNFRLLSQKKESGVRIMDDIDPNFSVSASIILILVPFISKLSSSLVTKVWHILQL
jgi:hypothetical protein